MPKPKGKGARGGGRVARVKAAKEGPKAKGAKPVATKRRAVAPKKRAKPVAAKPAAPPVPVAVSKPGVEKRKEKGMAKEKTLTPDQFLAEILTPEFTRETGHMCWDCKHFKPVIKGSKFPPADTIGWCAQIHWPFFWCVTDFNCVKKCYAFEKGVYAPYQPARFE